jgi:hypothetical protein
MMPVARCCSLTLGVLLAFGEPSEAGWRTPQGLGYLLGGVKAVAVYKVESVQTEKRLLTFKRVEDIRSGLSERFRLYVPREGETEHRAAPGQEASEWLLRWARPGCLVVSFNHQEVYVSGYWFQMWWLREGEAPYYKLSEWHALFGYSFAGSVDELAKACREILKAKETVVPVFASTPFVRDTVRTTHWRARYAELPLMRLKAGPKITRIPESELRGLLNRDAPEWRLVVRPGSGRVGQLPGLLRQLSDSDPAMRARAARQVGRIGSEAKEAVPRLARLLEDEQAVVRMAAAGAILQLDPKHATARAALWKALKVDDHAVRQSVAEWLWILDRDVAGTIAALVELQRDEDTNVATTATWALKSFLTAYDLKGLTEDDLRAAAQSPDKECARLAAEELAWKRREKRIEPPKRLAKPRASFKADPDGVDSLAFTPDGKTLASGGWDGVKLWDVATGRQKAHFKAKQEKGTAACLVISPDGNTLASGGYDNQGKRIPVSRNYLIVG